MLMVSGILSFQVINGYMNSLDELLEKHPLDAKMENTEVTVDWLAAKCDAMQLKIKYDILHVHMADTKLLFSFFDRTQ